MKSAFLRSLAAALAISTAFTPAFAANNYAVKDGAGTTISKCSIQQGDSSQADCAALLASENHLGEVVVPTIVTSDTLVTTSATTSWTAGQLIGSSTTAASSKIMHLNVCRVAGGKAQIRNLSLYTSAADSGFAGQSVVVQIYRDDPTLTNGDRGTWLTTESGWKRNVPIILDTHFSNAEKGRSTPFEVNVTCPTGLTYVSFLLMAGTTFTPAAGSLTLTLVAEVEGR